MKLPIAKFFYIGLIAFVALSMTLCAQGSSCALIAPGLVGWWQGAGNAKDSFGTNNGTLLGNVTYTNGEVGQAFQFSAVGDQVSIPTGGFPIGTNNRTMECWIYINSFIPGAQANFAFYGVPGVNGASYTLGAYTDQRLFFSQWGSGIFGPVLTTNQWYHVAVTSDETNSTLYLNGTNVGSVNIPFNTPAGSQLYIGGVSAPDNTHQIIGLVDEVSIYNRALSSNEIAAIYNAGSAGKCLESCIPSSVGIISWWPAEGNAIDVIGTNNGTLVGGVTFTNGMVGQGFRLDGMNSYVQIADSVDLKPTNVTVEAWVWLDPGTTSSGGEYIIFKKNSWDFLFEGYSLLKDHLSNGDGTFTDRFSFVVTSGGNQKITRSTTVVQRGIWYHVAGTYDGSTLTLYVNGVAEDSIFAGFPLDYGTLPVFIGTSGQPDPYNGKLAGIIDEPSIYGRALSSNEVADIYHAGSAGKCNSHPYIPPPRTATGTAQWAGSFVVGVTVIDGGAGYTNAPLIRFIGGGGTNAQASVVLSNGVVVAISIVNPGSGYTNTPVVVIDPPFIPNPVLGIVSISMLNFSNLLVGTNYQLQQFNSVTWVNQSVVFKATTNFYTTIVPSSVSGADYRLAQVPVSVQATAFAQVVNGFVVDVNINNHGSGYATPPNVAIVANKGSNAVATASVSGGSVTSINIVNPGSGYFSQPVTIQIDPPPTTALSPMVMLGVTLKSSSLAPYDDYQIQFKPEVPSAWENLNGGLFFPTSTINTQNIFLTNNAGFFRLQYVP